MDAKSRDYLVFHFAPYMYMKPLHPHLTREWVSSHCYFYHQKGQTIAISKRMIKMVIIGMMMTSLVLMCNVAAESKSESSRTTNVTAAPVWVVSSNCSRVGVERNLGNCSSFVSKGSTSKKPETSCCSWVKAVVKIDPLCLCAAFNHADQEFGYSLNLTRTLSLPAACNVSAPSFRNCTIFFRIRGSPPPDHSPPAPTTSIASAPFGSFSAPAPAPVFYDFSEGGGPFDYNNYENNSPKGLGIGLPLVAITIFVLLAVCWGYRIKKSSNKQEDKQNLESIIKQHGFLAPKRYSYSQIKKMTNSFRDKLGEGGFGEVYRGTLTDGENSRPVAVKILKATKADGEDFINEVLNISRTSHVNVVTLLGFCIDGKKRALIYEFMANGSLEKYIYTESISKSSTSSHLGWERLYQIALGVARGLEYLHRGCNTRILHFDIKPHNILLDQDFCPKISDFGLAKQCTKKESIISMLETRGTIGYIAPEVISRNFGGVSHKSDVYSYGMMLLEIVGGRKNICPLVSHTSEIYFPHWAYDRMVVGGHLKLQGVTTGEEDEIAKKMIIVGLWCIQNDPMQRPAMRKVIEMLEGSLESMEIPPKPFFGSPSRSEADCPDNAQGVISIS